MHTGFPDAPEVGRRRGLDLDLGRGAARVGAVFGVVLVAVVLMGACGGTRATNGGDMIPTEPDSEDDTAEVELETDVDSAALDTATADSADTTCVGGCGPGGMLRGVNVAGAEFGEQHVPGVHGADYLWPSPDNGYSFGYFVAKGMNAYRLPFLWERLQPTLGQPFDAAELSRLVATVADYEAAGVTVILDPHNYGRYRGQVINESALTSADFADLWTRLATLYANDPQVVFGLMNEPHDMDTGHWLAAANAAIAAIRATGADNLVLVPGNHWTGAHSWSASYLPENQRNGVVMQGVVDPADHFAFEVHQYLDGTFAGVDPACQSATIGAEVMAPFTAWLRAHGYKAFLGEFGAGADSVCLAALLNLVAHVEDNADVYLGWTYWAAGPWWAGYFTSLEPDAAGDKPQMNALAPWLP